MRKRYLKTFENLDEYYSQKNEVMGIPHVVLLEDADEVVFDTFATNYFTLEVLEDGVIRLSKPYSITSMSYSVNNGDWNELTEDTNLHLSKYDTVRIKGYGTSYQRAGLSFITTSEPHFNVYGNIMSLIYGDDFKDKKSLEGTENCFKGLLCDTKVVDASNLILPANVLTEQCYSQMFDGCKALTEAPTLSATTLASDCYYEMFSNCTSLTEAPALPATELSSKCYRHMFRDCSGLTSAPELPSTILADSCYQYMFHNCTNLTTAPALPATELASYCYYGMFNSCTSLTTAPALPATKLVDCCYQYMFENCSNLNHITMLATDIKAYSCLKLWVSGVAEQGTFIKHPDLDINTIGYSTSGIREGWTVEDIAIDYSNEYFTIKALEDGLTVKLSKNASQYSIDGGDWTDLKSGTTTPEINSGQTISFRIDNPTISTTYGIGTFTISKQCNVYGNIMSLLYGDNFEGQTDLTGKNYAFIDLFKRCKTVIKVSGLILPATTLAPSCYESMFEGCSNLITAPALPATTLASGCYTSMFYNCKALVEAPQLPATTLANGCYSAMFSGTNVLPDCTNIDFASEAVVASGGLRGLFSGTKVTDADLERILPKNDEGKYYLPVTTLTSNCYASMFNGCTSLTTTPALPATTLAPNCYSAMFEDCSNLITAPVLPATTLAVWCYQFMFYNCSNLNQITMLATDISAPGCLNDWVYNVAPSGTFVKHADLSIDAINEVNGIPEGWAVKNSNLFNGYEFVDLGLPSGTLWAAKPISNADGEPLYFQWGDTQGWTTEQIQNGEKTFDSNGSDYKWRDGSSMTKYNETDGKTILDLEDDAAHIHMGGSWHMPTMEQFEELIANTITYELTIDGIKYHVFEGTNGTILIPTFGYVINQGIPGVGEGGFIWSSTLLANADSTRSILLNSYGMTVMSNLRYFGLSVLGVVSE